MSHLVKSSALFGWRARASWIRHSSSARSSRRTPSGRSASMKTHAARAKTSASASLFAPALAQHPRL